MEGDEIEKSYLSAFYVDFSKYLSPEKPLVTYRKEYSRMRYIPVGLYNVGRN
jgi:hypothetical protein